MNKLGSEKKVVCIGEVLWDAMPDGIFLGGAPLNVCYHANQLGEEGIMVSRLGNDRLGREALGRIEKKKLTTDYLQRDSTYETGFAGVDFQQKHKPVYDFVEPVAWDFIRYTDELDTLARRADVIVFGTLAQRNKVSRQTIRQLCKTDSLAILDLNLRPPFDTQDIIEQSLNLADIVKLSQEELQKVASWFGYPVKTEEAVEHLAADFDCGRICITDGGKGAGMYNNNQWLWQPGLNIEIADTVGSGDAFLAGLITGLFAFDRDIQRLSFANALGAFVATKSGATPSYRGDELLTFARNLGQLDDYKIKT